MKSNSFSHYQQVVAILASNQTVQLPMLSGSMSPTLPVNSLVTITPLLGESPHSGDIIVFQENGSLTAHRLIFSLKLGNYHRFFQKGDCNPFGRMIPYEAIVGTIVNVKLPQGEVRDLTSPVIKRQGKITALLSLKTHLKNRLKLKFRR